METVLQSLRFQTASFSRAIRSSRRFILKRVQTAMPPFSNQTSGATASTMTIGSTAHRSLRTKTDPSLSCSPTADCTNPVKQSHSAVLTARLTKVHTLRIQAAIIFHLPSHHGNRIHTARLPVLHQSPAHSGDHGRFRQTLRQVRMKYGTGAMQTGRTTVREIMNHARYRSSSLNASDSKHRHPFLNSSISAATRSAPM